MKAIDLFCGAAGGWSLGWHQAGFETVAAVEIDPNRRAAFAHNNPGVRMYSDVRAITADGLLRDLGFLPDAVIGSPPCQDASTANHKGKGIDGERTGLFREYVRIVGEIRPRWALAENVPGLRTRGADWVLGELEAIGYAVWPLVVGAVDVGAPHLRKRVWFIAADPDQVGVRKQSGRLGGARRKGAAQPAHALVDANEEQQGAERGLLGRPSTERPGASGDTDEAGLAQRQGEPRDHGPQLEAVERAVGAQGLRWHGGPAGHLGVAAGVPAGLARQCVAAYGDAVVPRITQAIANAIRRTELILAAG